MPIYTSFRDLKNVIIGLQPYFDKLNLYYSLENMFTATFK